MNASDLTIVLCLPVEKHHVEKMRSLTPSSNIVVSTQQAIDADIFQADIFFGHAKEKPVPWNDVVRNGKLKWIQSSAAGLDHCLVPSTIASDIPVTSASGLFADQVAEQTMALLFCIGRNMSTFFAAQQKREFIRRPTMDLHGKTVGIVGFGGNGRRIAQVMSTMKVRIVATDLFPVDKPDYVEQLWPATELPQLLRESDVVILCVPLNDATRGMISSAEFGEMKFGSWLINVARGQVIDEQSMVETLQSGQLGGAGLDVTETEPLPHESPLWSLPNVVITPHVGAQSEDRVEVTVDFFCANYQRFIAGQPLLNLVDKRLGFPSPEHRAKPDV